MCLDNVNKQWIGVVITNVLHLKFEYFTIEKYVYSY